MLQATFCCVPEELQPLFVDALKLVSQHLGIAAYNATVKFHLAPPGYTTKPGTREGGHMSPSLTSENEARVKQGQPPNQYDISITVDLPERMILSFAHEAIHLRQWLTGTLSTKVLRKVKTKDATLEDKRLYFHGTPIDITQIKYKDMPWEDEAHTKMWAVGKWLIQALNKNANF